MLSLDQIEKHWGLARAPNFAELDFGNTIDRNSFISRDGALNIAVDMYF